MWNNEKGEFVRYTSGFRDWIRADGSTRFRPEADRYHLYVSYACPWAHRTLIVRALRGLEEAISVSVVHPVWNEKGWTFASGQDGRPVDPAVIPDFVNHQADLIDIYRLAAPDFDGVESVPILWDRKHRTVVNNESREIIRIFDLEFEGIAKNPVSLCPPSLRAQIDQTIDAIYPTINNGVYRAGFATRQVAYERAYDELFRALDHCEETLSRQRYLCGDTLTEADICLFTTLFRFDLVYYSHFKCNRRRLVEYPHLFGFVRDIYQLPGVAATCNPDHIKRHYYMSQTDINPTRIVPKGPEIDFGAPHDRHELGGQGRLSNTLT